MLEHIISAFQHATTRLDLIAVLCSSFLISYITFLALSRLYLSPLAGIPGPKLAALTRWYEIYCDIVKGGGGQFVFEYQRWHEEYGKRPRFPYGISGERNG